MVQSYRGIQVESAKSDRQPRVTVADYMSSKLITFHPEQSMEEVITALLKHKISGAPVVNNTGELVGIISEGDCMKEVVRGKYNNMPNISRKVDDLMSKNVITIAAEENIFDVAGKFLELRIRRFPVISHGKLVGQISQKDIMKAFHDLKSTTW